MGSPDDPLEQEADQAAEAVLIGGRPLLSGAGVAVHRKCERCREDEGLVQRFAKPGSVPASTEGAAPSHTRLVSDAVGSASRALPRQSEAFFARGFRYDFQHVRIHTGEAAHRSARALHARAYTLGSDIVFGEGEYAPATPSGQRLLAHELAHVVQQGGGPARTALCSTLQRDAARPGAAQPDPRREMVEAAASFLTGIASQVSSLRRIAAVALRTTRGSAAAPRAFHATLNQAVLTRLLRQTITIFEAQRTDNPLLNFPAESPEQTQLGDAFARAMEQLGLALEEARANALNLAPGVEETELAAYAENHLQWMLANPAAPLAAGVRDTFTAEEVASSTRRHRSTSALVANLVNTVHQYNLAGDGARRLRSALLDATYRLVPDARSGTTEAERDPALVAALAPTLQELDGVEWAVQQAISRIERAEALTRAFISDAAANPGTGATLQRHFGTRDPGYATLLAERLARMARELRGQGSLEVHARRPGDPQCTSGAVGGSASFTVAHARPNHFFFCGNVIIGHQDRISTVVHETVHAVIPSLGALSPLAQNSDTPADRSYAGERIYSRLTTEEAFDNAESYSYFVDELLGGGVVRASAPSDTLTRCGDTSAVHNAIARAAFRLRLTAMWAEQNSREVPLVVIQRGFPGADDDRARALLPHLQNLSSRLDSALSIECRPASDREGRAGALSYGQRHAATSSGVMRTQRVYPASTLRLCEPWFSASIPAREDALTAILILHFRSSVAEADVFGIVRVARFIQEQAVPAPAASGLPDHLAADNAARAVP